MSSYSDYEYAATAYAKHRRPLGSEIILGYAVQHLASDVVILDVGCGPGHHALLLANLLRDSRVVGVDASLAQIEQAEAGRSHAEVTNATFRVASAGALPFEDREFGAVILNMVLHHIEPLGRMQVLRELVRVARPGALIFVGYVSRAQALDGAWYYELCPAIAERFAERVSVYPVDAELDSLGCTLVERVVPFVGVFRPGSYFDASLLLNEETRKASSVFSLIDAQETELLVQRLEEHADRGTLDALVREHEARRRSVGQITIDVYRVAGRI